MRLSSSTKSLFLCLLMSLQAHGFILAPSTKASSSTHRTSGPLAATTAEEAAKRAGAAAAAAMKPSTAPQQPTLFSEELLTDMQQCLLKLERRVKNGAGAISMLEAEEFDFATKRILHEMKMNEHNRPQPAPAFPNVQPGVGAPPQGAQTLQATPPTQPRPQVQYTQPPPPPPTTTTATTVSNSNKKVNDISNDEGPTYDGTGGMGLSKGTVNTYVIPGMDEMSPEEYQKALQKSISDRQAARVQRGNYGNINANSYLDNLGGSNKVKKRWDPTNEDD